MVDRSATIRLVVIVLLALVGRSEAGFTIHDLGVLSPGGSSAGRAINNSGEVIGTATDANGGSLAVISPASGHFQSIATINALSSYATGISSSGDIAGTMVDATDGKVSAFSIVGNSFLKFGPLKVAGRTGGATHANGINAGGEIVGTGLIPGRVVDGVYQPSGFPTSTAFRGSDPNSLTIINPLGTGTANYGNGINGAGTVVGSSQISVNGPLHAFLATSGDQATDLFDRNAAGNFTNNIEGIGINDRADVIGSGIIANRSHAYFASASGGALIDLGLMGGTSSYALGLNNLADPIVVGQVLYGSSDSRAFLWQSSTGMIDLYSLLSASDRLTWTQLSLAGGINDFNQITGMGIIDGQMHGFVLTPTEDSSYYQPPPLLPPHTGSTPAPPALVMMAIGCALVAGTVRVRRGRTSARAVA
ncbi:hypothetical protein P12x_005436 [Tundrisphaera lichenicola]|uniref:hypothetical protein n=1 Tax=Tundrisphaera lichenicola TaxID=2029860 RepID=UPI003EBBA18A